MTVGEMPDRTTIFWHNVSAATIKDYACNIAKNEGVPPDYWAYCNIKDAKTYGFPDAQIAINERHNNVSPCIGAYLWCRTA